MKKTKANATDHVMVWKQLVQPKFWVCVSNQRAIWSILLTPATKWNTIKNQHHYSYEAHQHSSGASFSLLTAHRILPACTLDAWLTSFRFSKLFRCSSPHSRSSGSSLVWELLGRAWTAARDSGVDSMGPILLSLCCCHSWLKPPSSASASSFWARLAGAQRKKGI